MLLAAKAVARAQDLVRIPAVPRRGLLLLGLIIAVGFGPGCTSKDSGADDPNVVASFRGGVVERGEFDAFQHQELVDDPQVAEQRDQDWRVDKINQIAVRKALIAAAPDPDKEQTLQQAVNTAKTAFLRDAMMTELGWGDLPITQEEMLEYYDAHPEEFVTAEKLRLQHIYLRAEAGAMPEEERLEVRRKLEGIRAEILEGADYTEMAKQHSESQTARSGGWLTLSADADVFDVFAAQVWDLEADEISEIIETPSGYNLVKLVSRIPAMDRKFEDVTKFLLNRVQKAKLREARMAFLEEAGPRHGLKRHHERLSDPYIDENEPLITLDNDEEYTFNNLTRELNEHLLSQLYNGYLPKIYEFLDDTAVNRLLVVEATRLKLDERPEIVGRLKVSIDEAKYQYSLQQKIHESSMKVTDETLETYFAQNQERYQTMRTRDLDVIFLKPKAGETLWETRRRAEVLVEELRAGADFAEMARTHSTHYSLGNGGRLERLTDHGVARLVQPRLYNELNEPPDGAVLDPLIAECYNPEKLRYMHTGVIIVRKVKTYPPVPQIFEDVEDMVRENYVRRNYQEFVRSVHEETLESISLNIYFDRLPAI